jgi:hypothetical protein
LWRVGDLDPGRDLEMGSPPPKSVERSWASTTAFRGSIYISKFEVFEMRANVAFDVLALWRMDMVLSLTEH